MKSWKTEHIPVKEHAIKMPCSEIQHLSNQSKEILKVGRESDKADKLPCVTLFMLLKNIYLELQLNFERKNMNVASPSSSISHVVYLIK